MGGIDKNVLKDVKIDFEKEFLAFADERYNIFLKKSAGQSRPWTTDPILSQYKFTNLFRDDDRVSKFIYNWVNPILHNDKWLIANLIYARMCNKEATLLTTGLLTDKTKPQHFLQQIHRISGGKTKHGGNINPPWHDPYQICSIFKKTLGYPNRECMIVYHIPKVIDSLVDAIKNTNQSRNLQDYLDRLYAAWGYKLYVVFSQVLLDLSHLRTDLVPSDCVVPQGSGVEPLVLALKIPYQQLVIKAMTLWNDTHDRQMLFKDAEHSLCEFRKYLCWKYNLSNHRKYIPHE